MDSGAKESVSQKPPFVAVLDAQTLFTPEEARMNFDLYLQQDPKAFVLTVDAAGGSRDILNPIIAELKEKEIPVFLLSKNFGRQTGIQKITYGAQQDAVNAGAIPLRDVNVHGTLDVVRTIQEEASKGLSGERLAGAIVQKYGVPLARPAGK